MLSKRKNHGHEKLTEPCTRLSRMPGRNNMFDYDSFQLPAPPSPAKKNNIKRLIKRLWWRDTFLFPNCVGVNGDIYFWAPSIEGPVHSPLKQLQYCVPISILSVLTSLSLSMQGVPIQIGRKLLYWKDPDGVLKAVKSRSVDRCILFVLNGSLLSYVAEEGGARLSQSQRIFHIACINSHFVVFIAFIAFYSC